MKEKYLIYRDVLMICPCFSANQDSELEGGNNRFKLMGLALYGVNNNGRNVIFGLALGNSFSSFSYCGCLVTPLRDKSIEFVLKAFFYYMGKLPKAVLLERNQFGYDNLNCNRYLIDPF